MWQDFERSHIDQNPFADEDGNMRLKVVVVRADLQQTIILIFV